jgi:hypothetical protein
VTLQGPGSGWGQDEGPDRREGAPGGWPGGWSPDTDPEQPAPARRLGPLPIFSLLEVAARIIRRHLGPLLAVSALFQLPSSLIDAAAQQRLAWSLSPVVVGLGGDAPRVLDPTPSQARAIVDALLLVAGSSIVGTMLGAVATVAFTTAVLADYHGRPSSAGGMVRAAIGRAVPAIAAGVVAAVVLLAVIVVAVVLAVAALTGLPSSDGAGGMGAFLAILIGVTAVVLSVVVIVRLALPGSVLAGEPGGPLRALQRSWYLTADHTWRSFAVLAIVTFGVAVIGSTLVELLAVVVTDGIADPFGLGDLSDMLISAFVSTLLAPLGGVVLAVLYLDLRVRREGWQPAMGGTGSIGGSTRSERPD